MASAVLHTKAEWDRLYKLGRWSNPKRGLRIQCLIRDCFTCRMCGRCEHSSRLQAHHLVPHKGDEVLFWNLDNLVTLCVECHEQVTIEQEKPGMKLRQWQLERRGYSDTCDTDGYPIDSRHPFNENRPS